MSQTAAVIFVPGIRAKPPADVHALQLRRCLQAGLAAAGGDDATVAALGDAFDFVGWSRGFYGYSTEIAPDLPGIERLLSSAADDAQDRSDAGRLSRRVLAAFYAIGDRFPLFSSVFATRRMETRMQEINRYFRDEAGEGRRIRGMLAARLQAAWDRGAAVALIGHSFGSVIAWDTLWELSHLQDNPGRVDLFLTMGSPLTMRYVRSRLQGARRPPAARYPRNIHRWVNLAALGEVTALDRRLADCFSPMLDAGLVESITDNMELLNRFRGPDGLNPHKCYGYLASPEFGEVLLDWYAGFNPAAV